MCTRIFNIAGSFRHFDSLPDCSESESLFEGRCYCFFLDKEGEIDARIDENLVSDCRCQAFLSNVQRRQKIQYICFFALVIYPVVVQSIGDTDDGRNSLFLKNFKVRVMVVIL